MKILNIMLVSLISSVAAYAQTLPTGQEIRYNPIVTAVPFLSITPDARHAAMGGAGVASAPDANAQHWNAAQYVFTDSEYGVSLSYTPWLKQLARDINMGYLTYYTQIGEDQAFGSSLRYFSMGEIELTDNNGSQLASISPQEIALDFSYSRKLSEKLSGGVLFRLIRSDLVEGIGEENYTPGKAAAVDVSFYYRNSIENDSGKQSFSAGINLSDLGSKISYDEGKTKNFLPANLRFGIGYTTNRTDRHQLSFLFDINKLLVPTPTQSSYMTEDGNIVLVHNNTSKSVISSLFRSFNDAPGGFSEELKEINAAFGTEYIFNRKVAFRAGYFYENRDKGNRNLLTTGLGVRLNFCSLDMAWLFPMKGNSPLANTVSFSIIFFQALDR